MKLCSYGHISEIINGRCEICDTTEIIEYYSVEEIKKIIVELNPLVPIHDIVIERLRKNDRSSRQQGSS